jgi:hypothetical protein
LKKLSTHIIPVKGEGAYINGYLRNFMVKNVCEKPGKGQVVNYQEGKEANKPIKNVEVWS